MSSFFPFPSSSSNSAAMGVSDDPHLEVTVTPSASAFYAGETFSVTITFRNSRSTMNGPASRTPSITDFSASSSQIRIPSFSHDPDVPPPLRLNQIGLGVQSHIEEAQESAAGPSRTPTQLDLVAASAPLPHDPSYPYSPGADPSSRAGWTQATSPVREGLLNIRGPEAWRRKEYGGVGQGHSRKSRSLALGRGAMSPQEIIWALGGQPGQPAPPPLPTRRPQGPAQIPSHHPHSRKISITSTAAFASPSSAPSPLPSAELPTIPESTSGPIPGPSRPSSSRLPSSSSSIAETSSASRSRLDLTDDDTRSSLDLHSRRRLSPSSPVPPSRVPSYHNAYGTSYPGMKSETSTPPPPTHPYVRGRTPTEPRGTTTILWAYTRLVAHFHPSNTYIPPDPLLPLRAMLLHQPVGSGSLASPTNQSSSVSSSGGLKTSPSRWQMSFGTGTVGNTTQPSFTGSLFGLAKDLVYGGSGGSLEEERKRVWNMKDLPVLETARSLLGVDVKLKEGESREFMYTLQLPTTLPPAHRGRAFRFSYDLVVSVNLALSGPGKRQKSKEIEVPIRVWANVSLGHPFRTYDVLKPIIQNRDEGKVTETQQADTNSIAAAARRRSSADTRNKAGDSPGSLESYAKHLLDTLDRASSSANGAQQPSESSMSPPRHPRSRPKINSPSASSRQLPSTASPAQDGRLDVSNGKPKGLRPRQGSFVQGDDELVEEAQEEGRCGEAVEVLSRHSAKASYDIAKDGEIVAVLTLIKTTYRLGETVLGVVTFNKPDGERRVLKLTAYLESHELIPENLLPLSASSSGRTRQPPLSRLHAEHRESYAIHTSRLAFGLDIPSDATPAFSLAAGKDGFKGGLEWRVRLAFLVSVPHRKHRRSVSLGREGDGGRTGSLGTAVHLIPSGVRGEADNRFFSASGVLAPLVQADTSNGKAHAGPGVAWEGLRTETVECEVPVKVLAGNTAFVVRPSVHTV